MGFLGARGETGRCDQPRLTCACRSSLPLPPPLSLSLSLSVLSLLSLAPFSVPTAAADAAATTTVSRDGEFYAEEREEAGALLDQLERGVFDALERGFLKRLVITIHQGDDDEEEEEEEEGREGRERGRGREGRRRKRRVPARLLESYSFRFSYGKNGGGCG